MQWDIELPLLKKAWLGILRHLFANFLWKNSYISSSLVRLAEVMMYLYAIALLNITSVLKYSVQVIHNLWFSNSLQIHIRIMSSCNAQGVLAIPFYCKVANIPCPASKLFMSKTKMDFRGFIPCPQFFWHNDIEGDGGRNCLRITRTIYSWVVTPKQKMIITSVQMSNAPEVLDNYLVIGRSSTNRSHPL